MIRRRGFNGKQGPIKRGGERLARLEDGKRDGQGKWGDEVGRNPYTTIPETEQAQQWDGWGTALKPAIEPIIMARKPFKGTVAGNVMEHGTGGINVDGCRVDLNGDYKCKSNGRPSQTGLGDNYDPSKANQADTVGRWPANLIHDGSDEATDGMGDASRYFYCAKASKKDRNFGDCDNKHPTVKPHDLMNYLVRLVTPPKGKVLDMFMGSGSTGRSAIVEGMKFIGVDKDHESVKTAHIRIKAQIDDMDK